MIEPRRVCEKKLRVKKQSPMRRRTEGKSPIGRTSRIGGTKENSVAGAGNARKKRENKGKKGERESEQRIKQE